MLPNDAGLYFNARCVASPSGLKGDLHSRPSSITFNAFVRNILPFLLRTKFALIKDTNHLAYKIIIIKYKIVRT